MRSVSLKAILFVFAMLVGPVAAHAADATAPVVVRAPVSAAVGLPETIIAEPSPVAPPPVVRYGCSRIWRCDAVICEWRRGCFGTYGYMEGPYYSLDLAKRQWERHGWPMPERRSSVAVQPGVSLK